MSSPRSLISNLHFCVTSSTFFEKTHRKTWSWSHWWGHFQSPGKVEFLSEHWSGKILWKYYKMHVRILDKQPQLINTWGMEKDHRRESKATKKFKFSVHSIQILITSSQPRFSSKVQKDGLQWSSSPLFWMLGFSSTDDHFERTDYPSSASELRAQ